MRNTIPVILTINLVKDGVLQHNLSIPKASNSIESKGLAVVYNPCAMM